MLIYKIHRYEIFIYLFIHISKLLLFNLNRAKQFCQVSLYINKVLTALFSSKINISTTAQLLF